MKLRYPACKGLFLRRLLLLSIILFSVGAVQAQCPIPFTQADNVNTYRNIAVSAVVTANDRTSFSNTSPLVPASLSVSAAPTHGTATVLNDSTILYTPAAGYTGIDFYTYSVCNACGNCAQGNVTINISIYCPAPIAVNDNYTVYNDRANTLQVTANDTNTVGGPLAVSIVRQPLHGTTTGAGSYVTYQGNGTYTGADTVGYLLCDTCPSAACDTGYVYLTLVACAHAVANTDRDTLIQGATVAVDLTANDLNTTGYGVTTVSLIGGSHLGGSISLSGHTLTYRASANLTGLDSIRYRVCTDCSCDSAWAIFMVNAAPCTRPTAFVDNEYAGYSSTCSSSYDVLANDNLPPGGGNVSVTLVTQPSFGTATVVNNRIVYTCTDSTRINQVDLIRYSVCNACLCDTGTVAVHISTYVCNGRNPVINPDSGTVCRNYPVQVNVIANDIDPEGTSIRLDTIVGQAQHGIARKVNATTVSYTPAANYTGPDFFVYRACDQGTPSLCNIARVDIVVNACNSAPVILNAAGNPTDTVQLTLYEDSFATYCFHYMQADSPYVYIAHIGPSIDTIRPTAGSTTPGSSPCVYIAPPYQFRFGEQVQVVICNAYPVCDTVNLIINVVKINHRPHANPDSAGYAGTGCLPINVVRNDLDDDIGDHMTITTWDTVTVHGGHVSLSGDSSLCYMPSPAYAGLDTFHYTICDSSSTCATTYVIVSVPPVVRPDHASTIQDMPVHIDVRANDTHLPVQYLGLCGQPLHGQATVDSTGLITYTPDKDFPSSPLDKDTVPGIDSFCYTLCSVIAGDTMCANAEVVITVEAKGKFFIPQGISPNGDGVNDKFVIPASEELPKSQLLVFNRYGDEVWRNETDGYQNDFDGTWKKNGQPLPDMTYWYVFKYNDGVHQDRMGYIVIER